VISKTGAGLVLAVDTCGGRPGIAVAEGGRVSAESYLEDTRPRAECVAGKIAALFAERGWDADSIVCCGVTTGPGSYTGVRIGLALVRGLALPDLLPVVGIGSLALTVRAVRPKPPPGALVCAVLPAGRTRVYAAGFRVCEAEADETLEGVFESVALEVDELCARLRGDGCAWLLAGEGARAVAGAADPSLHVAEALSGRAGVLAEAAAALYAQGRTQAAEDVLPVYIGEDRARPNRNRVAPAAEALRRKVRC